MVKVDPKLGSPNLSFSLSSQISTYYIVSNPNIKRQATIINIDSRYMINPFRVRSLLVLNSTVNGN